MQSTWRVACVRIPRFPIGAVWRRAIAEENGLLRTPRGSDDQLGLPLLHPHPHPPAPGPRSSLGNGDAPSRSFGTTGSSSPRGARGATGNGTKGNAENGRVASRITTAHWDELSIVLADGTRVRAVTAAAARTRIRAGMTTAEARSRCAVLHVLPWDDVAVADGIRQATAAFLAASPLVTPVAGATGLWWIGASGLEALGGEPALVDALRHIARQWHPGARVSIADSCVAARAGTWDVTPRDGIVIVPPGGDGAYLASVPLGLIPMEEEIRETLKTLGIQTAGASRLTLASKNRNGVDFSALKAMTKPLMTKKISTPTQPDPTQAPISACGGTPPVACAEMPSG